MVCSFLFLLFLPFTVIVSSQTCKIYGSIKHRGNGKNPNQKYMLRVGDEESIMGCDGGFLQAWLMRERKMMQSAQSRSQRRALCVANWQTEPREELKEPQH